VRALPSEQLYCTVEFKRSTVSDSLASARARTSLSFISLNYDALNCGRIGEPNPPARGNQSIEESVIVRGGPDLLGTSQEINFGSDCPPSCPPTSVFLVFNLKFYTKIFVV
jgi:hypothetical protein